VIGFVILVVVALVIPAVNPNAAGAATGIILFIAVFGAVISYVMQMISFIVLRRRFPSAKRPYKSPTGIVGAVVAGVIAVAAFIGIVANPTFNLAVFTFVIIFVVGLAIFVGRNRLVLSPEEEYALSGGLHGDPQTEGYDAMEDEMFTK
jgi:ethanolamine permease